MDRFGYPVRVIDPPTYPDTDRDPAVRQKCQWQMFKDPDEGAGGVLRAGRPDAPGGFRLEGDGRARPAAADVRHARLRPRRGAWPSAVVLAGHVEKRQGRSTSGLRSDQAVTASSAVTEF